MGSVGRGVGGGPPWFSDYDPIKPTEKIYRRAGPIRRTLSDFQTIESSPNRVPALAFRSRLVTRVIPGYFHETPLEIVYYSVWERERDEECWFSGENRWATTCLSTDFGLRGKQSHVEGGGVVVWSERTTRCSEISWRTAAGFYLRRGEWERDAGHAVHCARIVLWTPRSFLPSFRFFTSETFLRIYTRIVVQKRNRISWIAKFRGDENKLWLTMLQVVCCCCSEYQSQIPSEVCFLKHWDLHWAILTTGPRSNPVTSWVVHQTKNKNQEISIFTLFIPRYVVFTHCITSSLFFFSFSNVHSSRTNTRLCICI